MTIITGLSGNEIYCLKKKALLPGNLVIGNSVYSLGLLRSIGSGLKILAGGELKGVMFEPTLLEQVDPNLEVYKDEVFGPVAILEKYSSFEQGIARINQSRFGLQAGIYTQSLEKMLYAWDQLQVGGVIINDIPSFRVDNMPYGGVKDSGLGREGIQSAIRDMQEERLLVIKR